MPLDVDLNLPASANDIDTQLELALPYEPPRTSKEPARDRAIRNSTMQPEEAGGSQRGQSASSGASGSRSRRVSHGQRSDGGEGDDLVNDEKQSVPQPRFPIFSCPICLGEIIEETATKCGHIFCRICISWAIMGQGMCPTCRRELMPNDTLRIYFPRGEAKPCYENEEY